MHRRRGFWDRKQTAHVLSWDLRRLSWHRYTHGYNTSLSVLAQTQTIDAYWNVSDSARQPQTFPRLSAAISGGGRVTKSRRLYPGYHLSTPEKPDLYSVPCTVPDTDSSSAVRFNTCVPGANLPAKVKMKEDTVQVQTEYSTYCGNTGLFPERTKEIADQERSFQNKPECKHQ